MAPTTSPFIDLLRGRLTDNPRELRNVLWITIANLLYGAGAALFAGELMQGYLTRTGFDTSEIGFLVSVVPFSNALGLLALMGLADRVRNRIMAYVVCLMLVSVPPAVIAVVALTFGETVPLPVLKIVLTTVFACQGLAASFMFMLDYPIIARAFTVGIRGSIFGILTMTYSILAVAVGWVAAGVLKQSPYPMGYAWCFMGASAAIMLRAAAYSRIRELPQLAVAGSSRSVLPLAAIVDVLKMKEFQWLGPPHILRGLCGGLVALTVTMGLKELQLPEHYPGYAASTLHAANICGGIALGLVADRWGAGRTTLVADTLVALALAVIMFAWRPEAFLGAYFVAAFGGAVEGSSVPLGCINIVPPDQLGAFSAARLMVLYGASAVGSNVFGYLFKRCTPRSVFALGAALKFANGLWFWYVFGLKKPVDLTRQDEEEGTSGGPPAEGDAVVADEAAD